MKVKRGDDDVDMIVVMMLMIPMMMTVICSMLTFVLYGLSLSRRGTFRYRLAEEGQHLSYPLLQ